MRPTLLLLLPVLLAAQDGSRAVLANWRSPHALIKSLDMTEVRFTDGFWGERFEMVRNQTIPVLWKALNDPANGASYRNFLKVIGREKGEAARTDWSDGDVYKYLETVAAVYALTEDPALDRHMDEMIAVFAQAQEPDGYLSTPTKLKGHKRWESIGHHVLYNMGHLMTAACIHYRATGKRNFLDIATKVADYLYGVFMPRPPELAHFDFNPSQIMGVAELFRATSNRKYLELAGTFVDMRGSRPGGADVNQSRIPLRKETEAVGHTVTANYLWAGAADVYAETGEKVLLDALERIWRDITTKKVYVTGAVGNLYRGVGRAGQNVHEAYGVEYELPHRLGYNETCANIASAMWNWRMLTITGQARYADAMELVLYNSMLSGIGVEGKDFYYNNPLRRHGDELPFIMRPRDPPLRSPILICYCCPPNVARTIAELNGWAYGKSQDALWVHLYGSSALHTNFAGGALKLSQTTRYPWDGLVRFRIEQAPKGEFALRLRIPGWAEGAALAVNGKPAGITPAPQSYAEVKRAWKAGDTVELRLPVEPRLILGNPKIGSTRNQAAVMRGPLVYALESPDLPPGVHVNEVLLPAGIRLNARHDPKLLGGVTVLEGQARRVRDPEWSGKLYLALQPQAPEPVNLRLIPYYAWSNRGMSYMTVWIPLDR